MSDLGSARLLLQLPLRDADRRPVDGAGRVAGAAKLAADAGALRAFGWRIPFVIGAGWRCWRCGCGATCEKRQPSAQPTRKPSRPAWRRSARPLGAPARGADRRRPDHGRHAGLLCLHDLHAEIPETFGRPERRADHVGIAASLLFAMILQPIYGALSDRVGRVPCCWLSGSMGTLGTVPLLTAHAARRRPMAGFLPGGARLADRPRLHLDQCGGEGRNLSGRLARHRRRPALCAGGLDLRRRRPNTSRCCSSSRAWKAAFFFTPAA